MQAYKPGDTPLQENVLNLVKEGTVCILLSLVNHLEGPLIGNLTLTSCNATTSTEGPTSLFITMITGFEI